MFACVVEQQLASLYSGQSTVLMTVKLQVWLLVQSTLSKL